MEWVDARLGESLARLTDCAPALAAKLRREAALGTEMGGLGVGGHAATCGACWCAFVLGRWDALRQACPLLRADEVGLAFGARPRQRHEAAGAPLDILLSARAEYAGLLDRLDVAYTSIDVEQDDVMRDRAIAIAGRQAVPVIVLPDWSHLVEPTDPELEDQLRALGLVDGAA